MPPRIITVHSRSRSQIKEPDLRAVSPAASILPGGQDATMALPDRRSSSRNRSPSALPWSFGPRRAILPAASRPFSIRAKFSSPATNHRTYTPRSTSLPGHPSPSPTFILKRPTASRRHEETQLPLSPKSAWLFASSREMCRRLV